MQDYLIRRKLCIGHPTSQWTAALQSYFDYWRRLTFCKGVKLGDSIGTAYLSALKCTPEIVASGWCFLTLYWVDIKFMLKVPLVHPTCQLECQHSENHLRTSPPYPPSPPSPPLGIRCDLMRFRDRKRFDLCERLNRDSIFLLHYWSKCIIANVQYSVLQFS